MNGMPRRTRMIAVTLTVLPLAAASFSGCGSGPDSPSRGATGPDAPKESLTNPGGPGQGGQPGTPGGHHGMSGPEGRHRGPHRRHGHNPASARDGRDRAPDDVISNRPGGPKPPGKPQPTK